MFRTMCLIPYPQRVIVAEELALLNLSVRTVETYREHIMRKLAVHSVAGLTRYALAAGLVMLRDAIAR